MTNLSVVNVETNDFTGATNPSGSHTGPLRGLTENRLQLLFAYSMSDVAPPSPMSVSNSYGFTWVPLFECDMLTDQVNGSVQQHYMRLEVYYGWAYRSMTGKTTIDFGTLAFGSSPATSSDRASGWIHKSVAGFNASNTVTDNGASLIGNVTGPTSGSGPNLIPNKVFFNVGAVSSTEDLTYIIGIIDDGTSASPGYTPLVNSTIASRFVVGNARNNSGTVIQPLSTNTGSFGGPFQDWDLGAFTVFQRPLITSCITVGQHASVQSQDGGTQFGGPTLLPHGGGEVAGYIEALGGNGLFTSTPTKPDDGALVIATVCRYSVFGAMPSTGTISGFGATWDLISTQTMSGGDGAAFVEVYRAQQATYTSGWLRYDFGAEAAKSGFFSRLDWTAFLGTEPSGLSDNGASAIRNLDQHNGFSNEASFAQTQPYLYPSNLMYTTFHRQDTGGSAGTTDLVVDFASIYVQSGAHADDVTASPQNSISDALTLAYGPLAKFNWPSPDNVARTWVAANFEMIANPDCAAVLQAYWGINATTRT